MNYDFSKVSNENLLEDYSILQDVYYNGWGKPAREAGKKMSLVKKEILSRMK